MEDKLFSVRDKICIVTGGLGQLGVNYAKELFSRGAKVSVWSRSVPKERIMQHFTQQELDTGRLSFYPVDINVKNSIEAALDGMERDWSDVPDVLINNAGLDTQPSAPPEVSGPLRTSRRRCSGKWWM